MSKKYYDPEYDKLVDESYIKNQYEWFSKQKWFNKSYEQFKKDNFLDAKKAKNFVSMFN